MQQREIDGGEIPDILLSWYLQYSRVVLSGEGGVIVDTVDSVTGAPVTAGEVEEASRSPAAPTQLQIAESAATHRSTAPRKSRSRNADRNKKIVDIVKETVDGAAIIDPSATSEWIDDAWTPDREIAAHHLVSSDNKLCNDFWKAKYEHEAGANWDRFYRRNKTNFFKDRHYLHLEFPELADVNSDREISFLEAGCGVGNTVFPLLEYNPKIFAYALDFAKTAIDFVKTGRCDAYVCDLVQDEFPPVIYEKQVDFVILLFCLSAIAPAKMGVVLSKVYRALKPGGRLLFRDYARYDQAQLRFKPGKKLEDNFYVRQDGTRAYFFTTEEIRKLCCDTGMQEVENRYIRRQYINRQFEQPRFRVWINATFEKPSQC